MEQNKPQFVFWGTPDVASETLEILKNAGYVPALIVTAPDRPQGRKMLITPPPVKVWAKKNNVPYIQPEKLTEPLSILLSRGSHAAGEGRREEKLEEVQFNIVVAYGKIMPEEILKTPRLGSLNIHYSLLPKYRGASPVEAAILNGDTETGVTIQQMEFKMDSGPVIATEKIDILPDEKASELRTRLIKIGGDLLVKTLPVFLAGTTAPVAQDESQATFCKKIKKEDGLLDLNDNAVKNYNKFRAYATWPRTYFFTPQLDAFENGLAESTLEENRGPEQKHQVRRIIITKAKLENNSFVIERVIPENGKEMDYKE